MISRPCRGFPWALLLLPLFAFGAAATLATATPRSPDPFPASAFKSFDPQCGNDSSCKVWKAFRTAHPFPYQTFVIAPCQDGSLALVISEPPPQISVSGLEKLIRTTFRRDLLKYTNRRWMIGVDGWVEDVVLQIKANSPAALANPENDPRILDRVGVLQDILFGTTVGGVLERADDQYAARARAGAPDVAPTPAELRSWVTAPTTSWRLVNADQAVGSSLLPALLQGPAATYIDTDRQFVGLVLPRATLATMRTSDAAMESLREPFREFATSSDTILGGLWNEEGAVVLIGRSRRTPMAVIPPLRFETFGLLAREQDDELIQSYERTQLFAGKLGPPPAPDWAPILLSPSLIDTELGALLNITDQFLKSWSEAGFVDYIYFDYPLRPAPGNFVFGGERLSDIIQRESGAPKVLFNWNTAGAAVVVSGDGFSVLAAGRTSALPVTYGSDADTGAGMQTGDELPMLRTREDAAYDYFAAQRDPNLARVVSYTLIYQILLAAHRNADRRGQVPDIPAHTAGNAVLVKRAEEFLAAIDGPGFAPLAGVFGLSALSVLAEVHNGLRDYYERYGQDHGGLALLLADPRRAQAEHDSHMTARGERLRERASALQASVNDWQQDNAAILPWSIASADALVALLPAALQQEFHQLQQERETLDRADAQFAEMMTAAGTLRSQLAPVVAMSQDLEAVRAAYVEATQTDPPGRIKTPSIVVSRDSGTVNRVGGHNLKARTLRIVDDPAIGNLRLERRDDGTPVLHVPPSQADIVAGHAVEIARRIEHENASVDSLAAFTAELPRVPLRTPEAALGKASWEPAAQQCALGCAREVANAEARMRLMSPLEQCTQCSVVMMRDADGYFISADREGGALHCCKLLADTVSLHNYLARRLGNGDVMVLGEQEAYVETLVKGVAKKNIELVAEAAGRGGGDRRIPPKGPPGPGDPGEFQFFFRDGRSGPIRMIVVPAGQRGKAETIALAPRDLEGATIVTQAGPAAAGTLHELQSGRYPKALEWDEARDGQPIIITVRPVMDETYANIVAGVEPTRELLGIQTINDAVTVAATDAARAGHGNWIEFTGRIKAYVDALPGRGGVKKILMLINEEGKLNFLIARNAPGSMDQPVSHR